MSTELSELVELGLSKVHLYRRLHVCPKCGERERDSWLRNLLRRRYKFDAYWCRGGAPATVKVHNLATGEQHDQQVMCAGVHEDHLHYTCYRCKFVFLTEVKPHGTS